MKTISIVNLKGGVGKTVTTVNMAAILAKQGYCTLVVDADPQANSTQFYGLDAVDLHTTVIGILSGEAHESGFEDDYIYDTDFDNIYCIPSDISLIEADIESVRNGGKLTYFADFLSVYDKRSTFDYCIVDCPPSFTAASVAAIAASDEIIIPVKIDNFAIKGMAQLMAQIDTVRAIAKQTINVRVLITMWHNTPAVVQGEALLRKNKIPVFKHHIRRSDKVTESTFAGKPLYEYSKTSSAGKDYLKLVDEFMEGGGLNA